MLSHATAREWLIPYADGMLSTDEHDRIDGHVGGCPDCRTEVDALRQLNLVLVSLPPAPPVAFAPFWLKLQAKLPAPKGARLTRFPRFRRAGIVFAAAAFAVLAATSSAFAAQSALPDSALYPLKQAEETVRLSLTPGPERLGVQIQIGSERLREAQAMAATGKPELAATSLRSFRLLIPSIGPALATATDTRTAQGQARLIELELTAVQEANASRGDDDAEVKQLVLTSLRDFEADLEPIAPVATPALPAIATPAVPATLRPTARPTERPKPKPSHD
jgi:Domain of unknown function (DUF5667)/Putative zinc-finger